MGGGGGRRRRLGGGRRAGGEGKGKMRLAGPLDEILDLYGCKCDANEYRALYLLTYFIFSASCIR